MGTLDEAIREHLELKRKRGAEQEELRKLEDEAFGQAERPDAGGEGVRAWHSSEDESGGSSWQEEAPTSLIDWQQEEADWRQTGEGEPGSERSTDLDTGEWKKREEIASQDTEHFDALESMEVDDEPAAGASEQTPPQQGAEPEEGQPPTGDEDSDRPDPTASSRQPPDVPTIEQPPPPPEEESDEHERPAGEEPSGREEPGTGESAGPDPSARDPEADERSSDRAGTDAPDQARADDEPSRASESGSGGAEAFDEKLLAEELDKALDVDPPSRRTRFFDEESDEYRLPQRPSRRRHYAEPGEGSGSSDRPEGESRGEEPGSADEGSDEPEQGSAREPDEQPDTGEDVLEETPEFLEETPEHDRLWFEQRPPKGFDFND